MGIVYCYLSKLSAEFAFGCSCYSTLVFSYREHCYCKEQLICFFSVFPVLICSTGFFSGVQASRRGLNEGALLLTSVLLCRSGKKQWQTKLYQKNR